jgi:hypothetical protein
VTRSAARSVANVLLVSAGVAAAYVVLTKPPLRRLAVTGLRVWLGASIPGYILSQVQQAWAQSAQRA